MSTEKVSFSVHPEIIRQLIWEQHGHPSKAILELIQNSIDAGASVIDVSITGKGFSVKDDGKGFSGKEDIIENFKTFGTPHEEGDAVFGRYRVGRGQCMALAHVSWRSGYYNMDVDLKSKDAELAFDLTHHSECVKGCHVAGEWYSYTKQSEVVSAVIHDCKYLPFNLIVNGKPIKEHFNFHDNTLVFEDEDLTIYHKSSGESISYFNLGIYAAYEHSSVGYDVVTKKQLSLNTARNFIVAGCKLKEKALHHIRQHKNSLVKPSNKWTVAERKEALNHLLKENSWMDSSDIIGLINSPILKESEGQYVSPIDVFSSYISIVFSDHQKSYLPAILSLKNATRVSKMEFEKDSYYFLDSDWVSDIKFDYYNCCSELALQGSHPDRAEILIRYLFLVATRAYKAELYGADEGVYIHGMRIIKDGFKLRFLDVNDLISPLLGDSKILKDSDLDETELLVLNAIRDANPGNRDILTGFSQKAHAWTDGKSFIAINRPIIKGIAEQLKRYKEFDPDVNGLIYVALLLAHEYGHKSDSYETLDHSFEFYNYFHDLVFPEVTYDKHSLKEGKEQASVDFEQSYILKISRKISSKLNDKYLEYRVNTAKKKLAEVGSKEVIKECLSLPRRVLVFDRYGVSGISVLAIPTHRYNQTSFNFKDAEKLKIAQATRITDEEVKDHLVRMETVFGQVLKSLYPTKSFSELYGLVDKTKYGKEYRQFDLRLMSQFTDSISALAYIKALDSVRYKVDQIIVDYFEILNLELVARDQNHAPSLKSYKSSAIKYPRGVFSLFLER